LVLKKVLDRKGSVYLAARESEHMHARAPAFRAAGVADCRHIHDKLPAIPQLHLAADHANNKVPRLLLDVLCGTASRALLKDNLLRGYCLVLVAILAASSSLILCHPTLGDWDHMHDQII